MKKSVRLLSLVLALLLAFTGAAVAETEGTETETETEQVNMFREYSTEELLAMKIMLETEIASRDDVKDFKVTVPMGRYIVGVDIPARAYALACPDARAHIIVRDQIGKKVYELKLNKGAVYGKLDLLDGYTVEIVENNFVFTPYKGLGF